MIKKYRLGCWQVAALESIRDKKICCDLKIIAKLRGLASKWDRKYKKSLNRAINAHNKGLASNSPIDPKYIIVIDECGYHVIDRHP
jgi:hypothetical protein